MTDGSGQTGIRTCEFKDCGNTLPPSKQKYPLRRFCCDLCAQRNRKAMGARCSVDGCDRYKETKSWCGAHYRRWRTSGDLKLDIPVGRMRFGQEQRKGTPCDVDGCDRPINTKGLCNAHYSRLLNTGDVDPDTPVRTFGPRGEGHIDKNGYRFIQRTGHPNAQKNGKIAEHRFVMAESLGRPLRQDESVHHKNGKRADNRIENLELMVSHPPGQRVTDRVEDALMILRRYAPHHLAA